MGVLSSERSVVLAPAHRRSGSLHRLAVIGSDTTNSILENSCLKTQPFPRCLATVTWEEKKSRRFSPRTLSSPGVVFFIHTILLHFRPTSARCVFCPTARKLNWRSMVLDFHCNKWIAGGDPTKVSGALCIGDVALMAAALKTYYLLLVCVRKKQNKERSCLEWPAAGSCGVTKRAFYIMLGRHFPASAATSVRQYILICRAVRVHCTHTASKRYTHERLLLQGLILCWVILRLLKIFTFLSRQNEAFKCVYYSGRLRALHAYMCVCVCVQFKGLASTSLPHISCCIQCS